LGKRSRKQSRAGVLPDRRLFPTGALGFGSAGGSLRAARVSDRHGPAYCLPPQQTNLETVSPRSRNYDAVVSRLSNRRSAHSEGHPNGTRRLLSERYSHWWSRAMLRKVALSSIPVVPRGLYAPFLKSQQEARRAGRARLHCRGRSRVDSPANPSIPAPATASLCSAYVRHGCREVHQGAAMRANGNLHMGLPPRSVMHITPLPSLIMIGYPPPSWSYTWGAK
jgi:hypothetical protein